MPKCPLHGREMICPACIGAKGGVRKSERKTKAVRENAKKGGRPRLKP